jgi:hypothetical protein
MEHLTYQVYPSHMSRPLPIYYHGQVHTYSKSAANSALNSPHRTILLHGYNPCEEVIPFVCVQRNTILSMNVFQQPNPALAQEIFELLLLGFIRISFIVECVCQKNISLVVQIIIRA